jgi:hypothetical protein
MKGRGWKEVEAHEDWDFFYADVGWIHENITYAQVRAAGGTKARCSDMHVQTPCATVSA